MSDNKYFISLRFALNWLSFRHVLNFLLFAMIIVFLVASFFNDDFIFYCIGLSLFKLIFRYITNLLTKRIVSKIKYLEAYAVIGEKLGVLNTGEHFDLLSQAQFSESNSFSLRDFISDNKLNSSIRSWFSKELIIEFSDDGVQYNGNIIKWTNMLDWGLTNGKWQNHWIEYYNEYYNQNFQILIVLPMFSSTSNNSLSMLLYAYSKVYSTGNTRLRTVI